MTELERQQEARRTGQAVTHTVAITGVTMWALDEYVFADGTPTAVSVFIVWAVPALSGLVTTWWARRHPVRPTLPQ